MRKLIVLFLALHTVLSAYVKIEIGSGSTFVPDSENLNIETSISGYNTYTYIRSSPRLEMQFTTGLDYIGPLYIGEIYNYTIEQKYELLKRLILWPVINRNLVSVFNTIASSLDDASAADWVAYDFSYGPIIQGYANSVLSISQTVTIKVGIPSLMQYGINDTLTLKVSVKEGANQTYILSALYDTESAGSADVFHQTFTSDAQIANGDSDGDGFTDFTETFITRTDPQKADTNDDGINDIVDYSLRLSNNLYSAVNDTAVLFGLLSESEVTDLRPSSTIISVEGQNAVLSFGIEESSNLSNWTDTGVTVEANLSAPEGTRFYRFKMSD